MLLIYIVDTTTDCTIWQLFLAEPSIECFSEIERLLAFVINIHQTIGLWQIVVHHTLRQSTRNTKPTKYTVAVTPTHDIFSKSLVTCDHRNASPTANFIHILIITHQSCNSSTCNLICRHMTIRTVITFCTTRIELKNVVRRVTCIRVDRKHEVSTIGISLHYDVIQVFVISCSIGDTRHLGLEAKITKHGIETHTFVQVRLTLPETLLTSIWFLHGLIHKYRIEIHQTVIRIPTTVTWVDINLHARCSHSFFFHLDSLEEIAIRFLHQSRSHFADRLLCEIELQHTNIATFCTIHDTT